MEDANWILSLLGRFHPLVVHFPIALLIVALFLEFFTLGGKRKGLREGINWMVLLGGLSAVLSAGSGMLLRTQDMYSGDVVDTHQYLGIITAICASVTCLLLRLTQTKRLGDYRMYRLVLFATVVLVCVTGHHGAKLTHGEGFLTDMFPSSSSDYDDARGLALLKEIEVSDSISAMQQDKLNMEVRAILAHNCYQCHSENKQKGQLILDSKEGVFKGGESGVVIIEGKPEESELYRRISLSPNDDEVMPKKGRVLKPNEIELIRLWIKNGAHWSDQSLKVFPEAELALIKPNVPESGRYAHPVDNLVDAYFNKNKVDWPAIVDDRVFIRRAYMDIIGLLPQPEEIAKFKEDTQADKRSVLIDKLLNDSSNYTQHWLSFWNDLLRNDYSGPGFITGGRKQITDWLYSSLMDNKPYDQMVRELVNPIDGSEGFIKGIKWRGVVNSSQRTEMQAAQNIGQSLMGVNLKCASCHNSFVSNLTLEQSYGFASVFADSLLELNRCDKPLGKFAPIKFIYPELGKVDADSLKERLLQLSEVMVKPANGRLYRTITNRLWERLMGRGIIEPLDEMDNTPWNEELLDWLAVDFIESGHDLKHLLKRIMTSQIYQLPSVDYEEESNLRSGYIFEGPILKRLSAEQFSDAISQIITPVYAAVAYDPQGEKLTSKRIWHPEIKFDRVVLPEPGKRYFRKSFTLPKSQVEVAKLLMSVDHAYVLYINGKHVASGSNWKEVLIRDVEGFLKTGNNTIALEGTNDGAIANPASVLFSMKMEFANGETVTIDSDKSWKSTADVPDAAWTQVDYDDKEWTGVRNYGTANWGNLVDFTFEDQVGQFARASLVKQHPFMKALGRPTRENVTTSRDEQATLLQALELTNGQFFNGVLKEGAVSWLEEYGNDSNKIAELVYQKALGRNPTTKEKKVLLDVLGDDLDKEELQDLFWSMLILPEFQFII